VTTANTLANLWATDGGSLIPSAEIVLECLEAWQRDEASFRQLNAASRAAHGLAGALGLFGFLELSMVAGELEEQLELILDGDLRRDETLERDLALRRAAELLSGVRAAALVSVR
jgi:HPt (histidine-containing phosphotransfer) domain-containing protein